MKSQLLQARYPLLTEFMQKNLYQLSAPTFEEAILDWKQNGHDQTQMLLGEVDAILAADIAETDLAVYLEENCDYSMESARRTIEYFRQILRE